MKTKVGYPDDRIRRSRLAWIAEVLHRPLSKVIEVVKGK